MGLDLNGKVCYTLVIQNKNKKGSKSMNIKKSYAFTTRGGVVVYKDNQGRNIYKRAGHANIKSFLKIALLLTFLAGVLIMGYLDSQVAQVMHING